MLCVRRWSDAGPVGRLRCQVTIESPNQRSKRFNFITKTIHSALLLGILFIYMLSTKPPSFSPHNFLGPCPPL